ncbi:phBC6A51 family helix-turn-helix protein [Robertmurraya sp. DFI.2.37]|uniref:phBC6A51 family helix-turn-helix protein n=1 Tax=Robertmurraya sp. DFI.2.37 TaxID=3031819 RepID=UPI00177DF50D|nr:phBC6A51 family helix-turn-helix protein [Robertmurraya sp. DFI.2.37]MDF1510783.1 phBC6A51 family helix-turn-helix protein [Robertmurraya sp. DFI.2.37]
MANPRFQFNEARLREGQRLAAQLLVEYEFTPKGERKTKDQIAEEVGISRMQLHRWDTTDENFIAYKNYLASRVVDSQLSLVYSRLIDGIKNGSMKGIELYLKRIGDLNDKSEVTINTNSGDQSFEERKAALMERLQGGSDE